MDFHALPRRQLQALCKQHKIPANLTNVAMATALDELYKKSNADGHHVPLIVDLSTPVKSGATDSAVTTTPAYTGRLTRSQAKKQVAETGRESEATSEAASRSIRKPPTGVSTATKKKPGATPVDITSKKLFVDEEASDVSEVTVSRPNRGRSTRSRGQRSRLVDEESSSNVTDAAQDVQQEEAESEMAEPEVPGQREHPAEVSALPEFPALTEVPRSVVEVLPATVVEASAASIVEASAAKLVEAPPALVVEAPAAELVEALPATVVETEGSVPVEVLPAFSAQFVEASAAPVVKVSPAGLVEVSVPAVEASQAPILMECTDGVESGVSVIIERQDEDSNPITAQQDGPAADVSEQEEGAAEKDVLEHPSPTAALGEGSARDMAESDLVAEAALCKQDEDSSIHCWFDHQISACEGFGNLLRQIREVVEPDGPMAAVDPSSGSRMPEAENTSNQVHADAVMNEIVPTGEGMCVEDFVQDVLIDVVDEVKVVTSPEELSEAKAVIDDDDGGTGRLGAVLSGEAAGAFPGDRFVAEDEKHETMTEAEEVIRADDTQPDENHEIETDGSATSPDVGMTEEAGHCMEGQPKAEDTGVIQLVEPTTTVVELLSEALADVKLSEEPNARRRRQRPSTGKENVAAFEGVSLRKLRVMYRGLLQTKQSRRKDVKPLSSNLQKNNQAK